MLIYSLSLKSMFSLLILSDLNGLLFGDEIINSSENTSESYYNDDNLRNESYEEPLFNQSYDSLNSTNAVILTNLTNLTQSDLVVTEDGGSSERPELNQKYLYFTTSDEDICSCDLNSNYCDINCCCDSDCTEEDMKVFSKCHSRPLVPDKNYCYQNDIILKNNTVYKMVKDPESLLFCIIHDNLKEHLRFKELPVLKSHRDLKTLLEYQSKYISSWNEVQDVDKPEWSNFKAGSLISIEVNVNSKYKKEDSFWKLPSACFTRMCSCDQEIRYLEDFNSFCSRTIPHVRDCQTNVFLSAGSYIDFCISSTSDLSTGLSSLIAHTKSTNSTGKADQCTRIRIETEALKPTYTSGSCKNVVSGVHFIVSHNGFHGISDISVKFSYVNVNTYNTFLQHFSVRFEWGNVTETERRSGNPGYQIGSPVLTGTNSSVMDVGEPFEITMQQIGLSVLDRDAESGCSSKRMAIKFGKNFKTSCFLNFASTDCPSLQERVFKILLGSSQKQVFVGVFGNANESNIEDWIEAHHEDRDVVQLDGTCNLITGLRINIAFAAVGTVVNPQYKILGVGYHYSKPKNVDILCTSECKDLILSTSVSFFDVTEPAIPHYPKVPSIKANLPSDFFYPFLRGKQTKFASDIYLVILMCLMFLIN